MEDFPKLTITEKGEKLLRGGHVWVYADEVLPFSEPLSDGGLCHVFTGKGRFLGTGFYNSNSKIRIRLISRNANDRFDADFWLRRVRYALSYRHSVLPEEDFRCCRLIFGEADQFPGLTVDRFDRVLVAEVLSLGIEARKEDIFSALLRVLREEYGQEITAIYERNESPLRLKEGMTCGNGFFALPGLLTDSDGMTEITENGIRYTVDYKNGQKTGFFLDQKYNRAAIRTIARGKTVLDCFTHTGSFGLNAAAGGAAHVTSVDISEDAIEMASENAQRNGLQDKIDYVVADVFDYLDKLLSEKSCRYDFIILDPPAFTKSRDTLRNAIKGYREINSKAMRLLPRGGYLATCSCSHFMTEPYFRQMLHNAAEDAGVSLRQIAARQQSPDHPILWNVPETDYLKFYLFQVV